MHAPMRANARQYSLPTALPHFGAGVRQCAPKARGVWGESARTHLGSIGASLVLFDQVLAWLGGLDWRSL